jgi:hypothetical protein
MLEEAAASKPGSQAIILCELVVDRWDATRWEPELDRRSEDLHRAFDPMLVEVDTCLRPGSLSMGAAIPTPFGVLGLVRAQYFRVRKNLGWTPRTVARWDSG